ncbi:uroporphyrinogen-III synthase [Fontibacillus panacisegetis]|uniref:Uroporphyrinogen-III synthase n=1 Tax=Fontibacillus panacisegetis TaxID=670482 RepID=A0A1G7U6C3_9BACL|nr:uroporphyrinogen-III synthase [Fontibacillus panacisegetis]SDG42599.1 uroporphyrinogen-III synthase [Fontibacillus panacisegetis]
MARRLEGKRVALTGPRRSQELGKLVENMGGVPLYRPAQGTVILDDLDLRNGIISWVNSPPDWSIFTTGVGLEALFDLAEDMGVAGQLWDILRENNIAARGYKTANALKKRQLTIKVRDDDGSTEGLIRELSAYDLNNKTVMLQLYGDPNPRLVSWLEEQGATCKQILPYRHIAPPEEALEQLLCDITEGRVDAVTFTSGPQVRFLMEHATKKSKLDELIQALEGTVIAVAVGKVTAQGLFEAGVPRVVAPKEERMGSMMVELARYYAGEAKAMVAENK